MKRLTLALLASTILASAHAQAPSPAQMGVTQATPQSLEVLDKNKTWVPIGTFPLGGPFNPTGVSPVGANFYANHAALVAAAPSAATVPITMLEQSGYNSSGDQGYAVYDWVANSYCPGGTSSAPVTADNIGCILPWSSASTPGRYLMRVQPGGFRVEAFGMVGDGVTDNWPLWQTILNFESNGVPAPGGLTGSYNYPVVFGYGSYYFSKTLDVNIQLHITGQSTGHQNGTWPTQLLFADNIGGIVLNNKFECWQYGWDTTNCPPGSSHGSLIENMLIVTKGGRATQVAMTPKAYGIWMRSISQVNNVQVSNFANDGIHAWCTGDSTGGKDNGGFCIGAAYHNVYTSGNFGSGIYMGGSTGCCQYAELYNSTNNSQWGVREEPYFQDVFMLPEVSADGVFWTHLGSLNLGVQTTEVNYNGGRYQMVQSNAGTTETNLWKAAQHSPPSGTTANNAWWWYYGPYTDDAVTMNASPLWGRVVESGTVCTVIPGQEANMWANDPLTNPTIWNCAAGVIGDVGTITPGTGGTSGQYNNVALTGGAGTGATAMINVSGGGVTRVIPVLFGTGYHVGDVLSASSANIGNTTGFSIPVSTIDVPSTQNVNGVAGRYILWTPSNLMVAGSAPYQDDSGNPTSVGPYIAGGGYRDATNDSVFISPYAEGTKSTYHHMPRGLMLGSNGIFNTPSAGSTGNFTITGANPAHMYVANAPSGQLFGQSSAPTGGLIVTGAIESYGAVAFPLSNLNASLPGAPTLQVTGASNGSQATCQTTSGCGPTKGRFTVTNTPNAPNTVFTITFAPNGQWSGFAPSCFATDETTVAVNPLKITPSVSSLVLTGLSAFITGDKVSYLCQ